MKILVGGILVILTFLTIYQTTQYKNFWSDEKYEIVSLCELSYGRVLAGQTSQANKNPLYFLLQKPVLAKIDSSDPHILTTVRAVSITAAVLLCLILFIHFQARLGLLFGAFAAVSLVSQRLFYQYAAENRPYMLWIALFALVILATRRMCSVGYERTTPNDRISFAVSVIGLTLVISFGAIQGILAVMTCLFFWYCVHDRPDNFKPLIRFALPLILLCILIQGYYTLQGVQAFYDGPTGSKFDLLSQIKKGDPGLIKMPVRMLLPMPQRDAYLGVIVSNLFVLVGLAAPLVQWPKRRALKGRDRFVFTLSLVTSVQAAATLIIALLIAFLHYFFTQRIFLYLIVCHALLAVCGAYFLSGLHKKIVVPVKIALAVLFCLSLAWNGMYYSQWDHLRIGAPCPVVKDHLDETWRKLDDKWQNTGPAEFSANPLKRNNFAYEYLDFMVERNRNSARCAWGEGPPTQRVSLCEAMVGPHFRPRK